MFFHIGPYISKIMLVVGKKKNFLKFLSLEWCKKKIVKFKQEREFLDLVIERFFVFRGHYQCVVMHLCMCPCILPS